MESQLLGHFSSENAGKVSQNHKNPSIWDTFRARTHQKCPKIIVITTFGTLFKQEPIRSVPKSLESQLSGHFSTENPGKVSQNNWNHNFQDIFQPKIQVKCPKTPKNRALGRLSGRKSNKYLPSQNKTNYIEGFNNPKIV